MLKQSELIISSVTNILLTIFNNTFFSLHLLKIVNSLVIVGQAVHYIKQTVKTQSEPKKQDQGHGKYPMSIIDPFEQRGNRTIIRPLSLVRESTPKFKAVAKSGQRQRGFYQERVGGRTVLSDAGEEARRVQPDHGSQVGFLLKLKKNQIL